MTEILVPNPLDGQKEELEHRSTAANALLMAAEDFVIDGPPAYEIAIGDDAVQSTGNGTLHPDVDGVEIGLVIRDRFGRNVVAEKSVDRS